MTNNRALVRVPGWREVGQNWYAVYTLPGHEKQAALYLELRDIECFLPLYRITRRWKDGRTVTLEKPLFPGYVFVHAGRTDRTTILGIPGILSIVGTSRGVTPLPRFEIESMRRGLHLYNAKPHPFLSIGERARILNGALAGLEGIVLRYKNSTRIVLTIEPIMKSVAVEIDSGDLESVRPKLYPQ